MKSAVRVTASPAVATTQAGCVNVRSTLPASVAAPIVQSPKSRVRTPEALQAEKLVCQQLAAYADGITAPIARRQSGPRSTSGVRR